MIGKKTNFSKVPAKRQTMGQGAIEKTVLEGGEFPYSKLSQNWTQLDGVSRVKN
jgi:hypothetical protein